MMHRRAPRTARALVWASLALAFAGMFAWPCAVAAIVLAMFGLATLAIEGAR